jgi:hypothetical protein
MRTLHAGKHWNYMFATWANTRSLKLWKGVCFQKYPHADGSYIPKNRLLEGSNWSSKTNPQEGKSFCCQAIKRENGLPSVWANFFIF